MYLRPIDLTTALRPSLLPDETLLFVQDAVGLYEGKFKIPQYQNGHAYLTSHRACYVDNEDPRKASVAVDLKDVDRPELYAGFMKSSPKITLIPKAAKGAARYRGPSASVTPLSSTPKPYSNSSSPLRSSTSSPAPQVSVNATWVCPICSFSNPVPSNFDPATATAHTPIPPCLACGIKPPLVNVVKAALTAMGNRRESAGPIAATHNTSTPTFQCPRCTFRNHPSLTTCEMCSASLVTMNKRLEVAGIKRAESPGLSLSTSSPGEESMENIKFSFRAGGEKIFLERVKSALIQRKWLLHSAPPVPKPGQVSADGTALDADAARSNRMVGIAGLERRGQDLRKNNELVIGNAFEDLEALMTSAKEIIALAEQFSSQANLSNNCNGNNSEAAALVSQSASALGLVTTKDMLGSGSTSDSLYVSELSRNLAEFLTDDARGVLKREGGIMSLVDLWAVFNRARGGVELISPADLSKAAQLWDSLKLPVRLRKFKSGVLVVQGRDRTDEKTVASLLAWFKLAHQEPPEVDVSWDWSRWGRGATAQEVAEAFGWSVGVATEELEMAEEKGVLCREQGLDGIRFWENWLKGV
ncbi:Vps36-domain-containing protein [Aulographum hederae CBS 113979]|uniref:Vacuolar protein-sorting-associated protein 36 n=1 Tax=Aulographum hederae CBS 113979 TaxID=1176131 RepID=A0A6G1GPF6_9PEZI|nr:Vps36-domain-containing protein [Aulographum hederae CBS 113979]